MKQYKKVLIIVASIMLALGIIMCGTAFLLGGIKVNEFSLNNAVLTEKAETITVAGNEKISLRVSTEDIKVSLSPDNSVHIKYYDTENGRYELTETDNKISFSRKSYIKHWYKNLSFRFGSDENPIELQIPQGHGGNLSIISTTGSIDIIGLNLPGGLAAESTTGDINCDTVTAAGFDFSASTGDITLSALMTDTKIEVSSSTGRIVINGIKSGELECENSTGGMSVTDAVTGELSLNATTGDIKVKNIDAQTLELNTTTGDISGSVSGSLSDYTIDAETTTGDCNLPKGMSSGSRELDVETTTGDINIEFENK